MLLKRSYLFPFIVTLLLFVLIAACTKSHTTNSYTTASLAGTYKLVALTWLTGGVTTNVYDSIDDCERDNLVQLNTDLSAANIDAGIQCSPPENSTFTWHVAGDSLYIDANGVKINSFDGKTLVYSGHPTANGIPDVTIIATVTLMKE